MTIDDVVDFEAFNAIFDGTLTRKGACSLCKINLAVFNKSMRYSIFQLIIDNSINNFCFALRHDYYMSYCKIYWKHLWVGVIESLEEELL